MDFFYYQHVLIINIIMSTEVSKMSFFACVEILVPKNFVSPCNEQLIRVVRSGVHRLE